MATISAPPGPTVSARSAAQQVEHNGAPPRATTHELERTPAALSTLGWGNSAPLALLAFGVPTFMLSMINAQAVAVGVTPVVFGVALMCGGITALIAGIIQLRTGNTFSGVLFSGFGAFWLSLFAIAQWFLREVPPLHAQCQPRRLMVTIVGQPSPHVQ